MSNKTFFEVQQVYTRLVKLPRAKLALFHSSFGVAAGRAIITPKQSLMGIRGKEGRNGDRCSSNSQHVHNYIDILQSRQNMGAQGTDYSMG